MSRWLPGPGVGGGTEVDEVLLWLVLGVSMVLRFDGLVQVGNAASSPCRIPVQRDVLGQVHHKVAAPRQDLSLSFAFASDRP